MSAIEASSGTYRCRVDGTIVLSVEISPIHRDAALALFGLPGTPMAIAALKVGHAIPKEPDASTTPGSRPLPDKPKGGTLAQSAGIICNDPTFQSYAFQKGYSPTAEGAAHLIRTVCGIESRAELDHNHRAAGIFGRVMEKYRDWQKEPA